MRYLLLVVASAFGYLMLANTGVSLIVPSVLGAVGAVVAEVAVWRGPHRRSAPPAVGAEYTLTPGIA